MRPAGPLPPRVYWVRRLLIVVLAAVIAAGVWWLMSGGDDGSQPSADATTDGSGTARPAGDRQAMLEPPKEPATGQRTPTADPTSTTGPTSTTSPTSTAGPTSTTGPTSTAGPTSHPTANPDAGPGSARHPQGTDGDRRTETPRTPLERPTGSCDPSQVRMSIDVSDSVEGRSNTATFVLRLPRTASACTLAVTPNTTVVRVTSGSDVVWSSGDCPDALLAKEVAVRSDPATVYQFQWNGRRSTDECEVPGQVAPPGGYWVEAALIGGEPQKAYFDVTEPRSSNR